MELQIKHLAAYMPYRLKCKTPFGVMELSQISILSENFPTWFSTNDNYEKKDFNFTILNNEGLTGKSFMLYEIKPILRPLKSMLDYEKIEFNNFCIKLSDENILPNIRTVNFPLAQNMNINDNSTEALHLV